MARSFAISLASFALALAGHAAERQERDVRAPGEDAAEHLEVGDWEGIRSAHEASTRGVVATPEGHAARHRSQQWHSAFDGRGVTVTPDDRAWVWGLELERWGFEGTLREVDGFAAGCAEGDRLEYEWNASLTEWYVNGASGLEHGYTVHSRPEGHRRPEGEGALVLELAVRGDLTPEVDADGRGSHFVDGSGTAMLTYAGLAAFDASNRPLEARLVKQETGLRIEIDARGARYPLTIDPTLQQVYLKASNTQTQDFFGIAVSVSGDTVVVGARDEDSDSNAINIGQTDNSAANAGAAYVFVRGPTNWSQQAYLKASNSGAGDIFGVSVSISGNTAVIGACQEGSNSTTINAGQTDNSAAGAGAAYVFVRSGTTWSQQAYLKASNTGTGDQFGAAVCVSGDTVVVGAPNEDSNSTTIDAGQADNSASASGAAYVFVRSAGTWTQQAYLKASNAEAGDEFGGAPFPGAAVTGAVSVSGDTIVVGASGEDSNSTAINSGGSDNSATDAGAAYVFARSGTTWSQQAYLKASNTGAADGFGATVSASGETAIVGATGEDSNSTMIDMGQADNSASGAGAAYVFARSGTTWSQQAYLKPSNAGAQDEFGFSVAVDGEMAVVGAVSEDSNSITIDAGGANNSFSSAGAAYVFGRSGTSWSQQSYLKALNTNSNDRFGRSVAVSGDLVVVTAPNEASNATVIMGNFTDNSAPDAGAAYAFFPTPAPVPYCFGDGSGTACPCSPVPVAHGDADKGCPNNVFLGGAKLAWSGTPSLAADTLVLTVTNVLNLGGCLVFQGTTDNGGGLGTLFGDGLRCAAGAQARMRTHIVAGNMYKYPDPMFGDNAITIRGAVTIPGTRYYQGWYRSANPTFCTSATFNLTNGLRVIWGS